ncbi:MAG: glycoside hydrolase family 78 protein [Verrucomicrobiota bacterium]
MKNQITRRHAACLTAAVALLSSIPSASAAVTNLRCEYLADPLGIDVAKPRLNWVIETGNLKLGRGIKQTAYQILVAGSEEFLKKDKGDLWDSGKVESEQSVLVEYHGKPLRSWKQCHWKVRVWDKDGKASDWSQPAAWTMGLLDSNAWQAKWIGAETNRNESLLLRRNFAVKSGLRRAVVAVCGLGHYELTLNGKRVSEDVLAPGWTKYNKTCLYDMYDVTESLRTGNNALGLFLGNGMYNVKGGRYAKFTGSFGPQKAIAQLRMEFEDGTSETLVTDGLWRVHSGPVTFTCVYGGEDYDARLCQAGWDKPGFTDATWEPAVVMQGPGGALKGLSCAAPPVRCFDTFKPVKTTVIRPGVTVYDFGQNAAQMPRITVSGPRGASVRLAPAEIAGQDNSINQGSVGGNISCSYWLDGSARETWSPRFFYCGYRYLQLECVAAPQGGALPLVEALESRVVHTSSTPIGEFSTSNELINRIYKMIRWAQRSNMVSVMTDCPHREKLGWLEQTHLNGPALRYNYDLNAFFSKIMNDMADSQHDDGLVPDIAPEFVGFCGGFRDSPEWGSAFPQVAWHQYQYAGDVELLRRYYDGMARYVAFLERKAGGGRIILSESLGDWRQLEKTPNAVSATAMLFDDARILAKMAELLGKTEDAVRYGKLAAEIRDAFNKRFLNPATREYATGTQTANAIPLDMGMVPEENRAEVLGSLVKRLQADGLKAGEIGFPYLLRALANGGRSDVIFAMINQTDKPGYGFQLNYGATSLPEDWDYQPSNSQNHFMFGHINEWFYHDLAGIQYDPAAVGFKKIIIKPVPVGDLTWVKAHYDSLYGRIVSNWKLETRNLKMDVTIPINTTATVYVPAKDAAGVTESGKPAAKAEGVKFLRVENNAAVYEVGSGCYQFCSEMTSERKNK